MKCRGRLRYQCRGRAQYWGGSTRRSLGLEFERPDTRRREHVFCRTLIARLSCNRCSAIHALFPPVRCAEQLYLREKSRMLPAKISRCAILLTTGSAERRWRRYATMFRGQFPADLSRTFSRTASSVSSSDGLLWGQPLLRGVRMIIEDMEGPRDPYPESECGADWRNRSAVPTRSLT